MWYTKSFFAVALGGTLPFGAVFIELYFIFSSLWLNQLYYIFGFLTIVFVILVITCAEMRFGSSFSPTFCFPFSLLTSPPKSIVMCYFQLCGENYHWQWRSVIVPASSGIYLFLYSCFYFFSALKMTRFVSIVLYFGYSFLMATAFSLMTGCVGFLSCKWFVGKIYTYIKLD